MQSQETPRTRRVHGAQIKSKVLAACRRPGASVSAVALAHGLNANLVHKWLRGQGLQRAGLAGDATVSAVPRARKPRRAQALQFVPIDMASPAMAAHATPARVKLLVASLPLTLISLGRKPKAVQKRSLLSNSRGFATPE